MMGQRSETLQGKRIQGLLASKRFRKLIYQELDRRVCCNVDYGGADSLFVNDTLELRTQFAQQIALLDQIVALNASGQLSLSPEVADTLLADLVELDTDVTPDASIDDQVTPNDSTQKSTVNASTARSFFESLASLDMIWGGSGQDNLDNNLTSSESTSTEFAFVLLNSILQDSLNFGIPSVLEVLYSHVSTNHQPLGDNSVDPLSPTIADSVLPYAQSPLASPLVSTQLASGPTNEIRSTGLVLQPSLPSYGQSTLAQAFCDTSSRDSSTASLPLTAWFVGKSTNNKEASNDNGRLISRQETPAAKLQRAHMTIARSRRSQNSDNAVTAQSNPSVSNNESLIQRKPTLGNAVQTSSAVNSAVSTRTVQSAGAVEHPQPINDSTQQYSGDLQSVRDGAVEDTREVTQNGLSNELKGSKLSSILQQQAPVAVVVAVGALVHRSRLDNSEIKPPKNKLQSTETRDISYPV